MTTASAGNTAGAFALASNAVTVSQAGRYYVWYAVTVTNGAIGVTQLFVNGVAVPGTQGQNTGAGASGAGDANGAAVVNLAAASVITIRNVAAAAFQVGAGNAGRRRLPARDRETRLAGAPTLDVRTGGDHSLAGVVRELLEVVAEHPRQLAGLAVVGVRVPPRRARVE